MEPSLESWLSGGYTWTTSNVQGTQSVMKNYREQLVGLFFGLLYSICIELSE